MKEPDHLYEYLAKVVSVYDGDTIRVDIDLGFQTWIHDTPVRLLGIDAPELRGEEREAGLIVRDWLRARLLQQERVLLRTRKDKQGKYGRWLADVFVWNGEEWESINQAMVDLALVEAKEY